MRTAKHQRGCAELELNGLRSCAPSESQLNQALPRARLMPSSELSLFHVFFVPELCLPLPDGGTRAAGLLQYYMGRPTIREVPSSPYKSPASAILPAHNVTHPPFPSQPAVKGSVAFDITFVLYMDAGLKYFARVNYCTVLRMIPYEGTVSAARTATARILVLVLVLVLVSASVLVPVPSGTGKMS